MAVRPNTGDTLVEEGGGNNPFRARARARGKAEPYPGGRWRPQVAGGRK